MRARDNPFAAGRFDSLRYRFPPGTSMQALLDNLKREGMRGAIVAPEGHGKSTLMSELGDRLREEGFAITRITLREGESRLSSPDMLSLATLDRRSALLLDGGEQLSLTSWLVLRNRARAFGAFVITSHRLGMLPTIFHCATTPAILEELLDELAPARPPGFPSAEDLWTRHRGDLRQALFEAYDAYGES